jgi:hypothetical protein
VRSRECGVQAILLLHSSCLACSDVWWLAGMMEAAKSPEDPDFISDERD